jgi:DNA-binding MarR family transcriptional regulator
LDVYPLPDYIGANVAIETDIEINNYHFNNIKNGFSATALINFSNGVPQEEEKPVIEKQIQQKFTGTDNAGKFIINFSDGKDKAPEVLILNQSDAHHQFEQLRKDVMQEMFVGHRITSPMLLGVRVEGQLGGRSEMIEANELFQNTYITPIQESINEIFNMLITFNGVEGKLSLNKVKPIGLDWFGSDKLYNILTTEEKRELAGLKNNISFKKEPKDMGECISMMMNEGKEHDQAVAICINKGFKSVFSKYGRNRKDVSILDSKFINYTSEDELLRESDKFKFALQGELTTLEQKVLDILSSEPTATANSISEALNVSEKKIKAIIKSLEKDGVLKIGTTKEGGEKIERINPTKEGKKLVHKIFLIHH